MNTPRPAKPWCAAAAALALALLGAGCGGGSDAPAEGRETAAAVTAAALPPLVFDKTTTTWDKATWQ
ncbi:hypothetical protein [Azohydromonas aeria]|uniref:hypothetical protein n=1 Tax=Azohydromonas aeria TaxID=2590212 RepID=UPI0012F9DB64|nr:hypothetical protein [Azohydromonas aeria]